MIRIVDKRQCCGCAACVQKCPKHCISFYEDEEGFLYPRIDTNNCIDCGLCEKVCPFLNCDKAVPPQEVWAVKNKNESDRIHSSSGGVFIALAREVLAWGGVVFGAVFDENYEVKITYSETLEGVRSMMGSKYLQARVETGFADAERFLKEGRHVFFSGTPCQIAGLHKYLRKDYSNLLSVDFLCHGVPSPGVWRRYLKETMSDLQSAHRAAAGKNTVFPSLNVMPTIVGIEFRDKTLHGWKKYSFVVRGRSAFKADKNSVLLSDIHRENPFMKGFLSDIYLRPSCYECKCKNGVSHSDLTIADFWGIDRLMSDFDDDKGVGLVLVNTTDGKRVLDELPMEKHLSSLADVQPLNGGFKEYTNPHPRRIQFFKRFVIGERVDSIVENLLHVSWWRRAVRRIKKCVLK